MAPSVCRQFLFWEILLKNAPTRILGVKVTSSPTRIRLCTFPTHGRTQEILDCGVVCTCKCPWWKLVRINDALNSDFQHNFIFGWMFGCFERAFQMVDILVRLTGTTAPWHFESLTYSIQLTVLWLHFPILSSGKHEEADTTSSVLNHKRQNQSTSVWCLEQTVNLGLLGTGIFIDIIEIRYTMIWYVNTI